MDDKSQSLHHGERVDEEMDEYADLFDVRTLLSWSAPGRPFRKKDKEYYFSAMIIVMLVEIILFLFSEYSLMVVVLSLVFLAFVLSFVPPKNFHYRISTEGVTVEDHYYLWTELYDFYFKKIDGVDTLIIRTETILPGELKISLGNVGRDHVRRVMVHFLPYREKVKETFTERSGEWLARNFPLDKHH
ncbi:hypothetical protein C4577_00120 [Candidatus Parcubacteria bacterium]|nr:MAG: hypothetical protein C4577_00120 [Candidatus Parcubacteria bacterium]